MINYCIIGGVASVVWMLLADSFFWAIMTMGFVGTGLLVMSITKHDDNIIL